MSLVDNYLKEYPHIKQWNEEDKKNFFLQLTEIVPNIDNLSIEQNKLLEEIKNVLLVVEQSCSILKNYGIEYELSLTGGVIRDFIMNKCEQLNDYDIVIHFPQLYSFGSNNLSIETKELKRQNIEIEELLEDFFPNFTIEVIDNEILTKLLHKVVTRSLNNKMIKRHFDKTEDYQNGSILGMLKIKDRLLNKPVDLIISTGGIIQFVGSFDFDLCKGYIRYKGIDLNTENYKQLLLDNMIISRHMVNDITNKQMTVNLQNLTEVHLDYYMNKHYIKMKNKYPEFDLNYRVKKVGHVLTSEKERLDKLEAKMLMYIYDEKLGKKEDKERKHKI